MRRLSLLATLLAGCLYHQSHVAVDGAVLGRVVIYRNGVAFYERRATVIGGKLAIHVPRDRVDDFLKSLTVVDGVTRKPLAVSIPREQQGDGGFLTMTLETSDKQNADVLLTYVTEAPAWKPSYRVVVGADGKVMLEGWAIIDNVSGEDWKDVLVGVGASSALAFRYDLWSVRRVDRDLLQGEDKFAIAPPTGVSPYAEGSEELVSLDGNEVRGDQHDGIGMQFSGASSAENTYAVDGKRLTTGIAGIVTDSKTGEKLPGVTVIVTSPALKETETAISDESGAYHIALQAGDYAVTFYYADVTVERKVHVGNNEVASVTQRIDQSRNGGETIRIAATAPGIDATSTSQSMTIDRNYIRSIPPPGHTFNAVLGAAAGSQSDGASPGGPADAPRPPPPPPPAASQGDAKLHGIVASVLSSHKDLVIETHAATETEAAKRAQAVRDRLIDEGVPAAKIHVIPKIGAGEAPRVRVLALAPGQAPAPTAPPTARQRTPDGDDPVGEAHFMAERPMSVRAGTSAMVAMVHGETAGGVVYLYDPISDRGDQRFAFKAVRLDNPTTNTLEAGPVTVYGDGRFIGEGITEPVPPQASVVVPFALDKQIVVSQNSNDSDTIAKLVTAERGIVTAQMQHRRQTRFTITSRLPTPSKVYLRHRLADGWEMTEAPKHFMRVGDSQLFEIELGPHETQYVTLAEATPVEQSFDLSSDAALGMMQVYIDEPDASPQLKEQIAALLATHRSLAELADKIATLHDQLAEYRERSGELHGQLVTLKLVRTSGELMTALHAKLVDTQERMQKTTLAIVDAQEQVMLAKVKFQNQLVDLHLGDAKKLTKR